MILGRGYDCDVIVDDPYVAARHVQLGPPDGAGGIAVRELDTRNGLHRVDTRKGRRGQRLAGASSVQAGQWLEAGRTRWRVCRTDTPVAPERLLEAQWHAPAWLNGLLVLAVAAAMGFEYWFAAYEKFEWLVGASAVFAVLGGVMAWAAAWGLLARLFHAPAQFSRHLAWACAMVCVALMSPWPLATLAYGLDWPGLLRWAWPLSWALAAVGVAGHWLIAFGRPGKRASLAGLAFLVLSIGMTAAGYWQAKRQLTPVDFMAVIRPPGWHWTGAASLDDLYRDSRAQRSVVDSLRSSDANDEADDGD